MAADIPKRKLPDYLQRALDELVDAEEGAGRLGLAGGQRSFTALRSYYVDFPNPVRAGGKGRCQLWWGPDLDAWRERHPSRGGDRPDSPS